MQVAAPHRALATLATNVFDDNSLTGSKVLLSDNCTFLASGDGGGSVVVDVEVIDLASADAGTTPIVKAIPREIAVTSDDSRVVYVVPLATLTQEAGIYVAPIP